MDKYTKKTRAKYEGKVGYIIGQNPEVNMILFQADHVGGLYSHVDLMHNVELFDGCVLDGKARSIFICESVMEDIEIIEQRFTVGQKVSVHGNPERIRTVMAYLPFLTSPYLVTDSDGERKLDDGIMHNCDVDFFEESSLSEFPNTIDITVKVNGKEVPLSSISEDTLLNIRKNS